MFKFKIGDKVKIGKILLGFDEDANIGKIGVISMAYENFKEIADENIYVVAVENEVGFLVGESQLELVNGQ